MSAGESIILEEDMDENYEPSPHEISEYAEWLGMDARGDRDLLWIAREGLKAPLPQDWKPCKTEEGEIYYFNFQSGESVWDHPCDEYYRCVAMLLAVTVPWFFWVFFFFFFFFFGLLVVFIIQ
jgi:hypothetical protein